MLTVEVTDPRAVRATSFLPHGEKTQTWLRPGTYRVDGEVWLDTANNVRATMLVSEDGGKYRGTFYVPTAWLLNLSGTIRV